MPSIPVNLPNWLLAFSPILVVLVLMVGFRWGGARAGPVGWFVALLVAVLRFGAGVELIAYSQMKATFLTVYVLYIIWAALVLYNVANQAGAITVIGQGIVRLTGDRMMQLLLLGWIFCSFLQGVAGFGVPIAVVAPLLIGIGFPPVTAVTAATVGYSWAVSFGSMASAFQALLAATDLAGLDLAPWAGLFLGLSCLGCGLGTVHIYAGWRGVWRGLPAVVVIGLLMGGTQYVLAVNGLWAIAAFMAGLVGLAAGAVVARLSFYHGDPAQARLAAAGLQTPTTANNKPMSLLMAVSAYLVLVVIVVSAELVSPLKHFLGRVQLRAWFPEVHTSYGWTVAAGYGRAINVFGHAGALLMYAAIIAYFIYHLGGHYTPGAARRVVSNTVRSAARSSLGIAAVVAMAMLMSHSGMTYLLAEGLSRSVGRAFPLMSPFIGLLGAFMTGSNTNSNVVFAPLQMETARLLGVNVLVILGAQTTGGALGSMVAPAKIIVGCSTAGLAGREGEVLKRTLLYGVVITLLVGIVAWGVVYVIAEAGY